MLRYLAARPRSYADIQAAAGINLRTAVRWIGEIRLAVREEHWAETRDERGRKTFQVVDVNLDWIEPAVRMEPRGQGWTGEGSA